MTIKWRFVIWTAALLSAVILWAGTCAVLLIGVLAEQFGAWSILIVLATFWLPVIAADLTNKTR